MATLAPPEPPASARPLPPLRRALPPPTIPPVAPVVAPNATSGDTSAGTGAGAARTARPARRGLAVLLTIAVGLAFADASVVALALPDLYTTFDTSIVGVSWVLT